MSATQWSWKCVNWAGGKGSASSSSARREQRGRAGDAVGDQQREQIGVVVAPVLPVGLGDQRAAAIHDPRVAVDELRAAELGEQRLELLGVPGVVLVGHRHVLRGHRRQGQRALEVAVEAEPRGRARDDEALVAGDGRLDRGEARGVRAVVADDAHPVAMALGADRVELAREQVERRLVGGHADGDQRPVARRRRTHLGRRRRLRSGDVGQRRDGGATAFELGAQQQLARDRADPRDAPEAAGIGVGLPDRVQHVDARHPVGGHRLRLAVDHDLQLADRRARAMAPARDEQRRAAADRQLGGKGRVEMDVQVAGCGHADRRGTLHRR